MTNLVKFWFALAASLFLISPSSLGSQNCNEPLVNAIGQEIGVQRDLIIELRLAYFEAGRLEEAFRPSTLIERVLDTLSRWVSHPRTIFEDSSDFIYRTRMKMDSDISHGLGDPYGVMTIAGFSALLRSGILSQAPPEYCDYLEDARVRLMELTLDLDRVVSESGRIALGNTVDPGLRGRLILDREFSEWKSIRRSTLRWLLTDYLPLVDGSRQGQTWSCTSFSVPSIHFPTGSDPIEVAWLNRIGNYEIDNWSGQQSVGLLSAIQSAYRSIPHPSSSLRTGQTKDIDYGVRCD